MRSHILYAALSLGLAASNAMADDAYQFHQLRITVGTTVGATFDAYARLVSRHIGNHLPGHPTVFVENMAGAGGLTAANYLYNIAPKDGTTIGVFARGLPTLPLLDKRGIQYDPTKFNWLGSPASEVSLVWSWYTTPFKTFEDIQRQQMIIPATGPGADSTIFPYVLNAILGTKFKVIPGYPGGAELFQAVEQGEAQGIASTSWSNFATGKKEWIADGNARLLLQLALKRDPAIGEVPLVLDKAKSDEDRKVLELIFSRNTLAYPVVAPPDVPPERVTALRDALRQTAEDPDYQADAKQQNLPLDFVSGEQMDTILNGIFTTSPQLLEKAKEAVQSGHL